MWNCVCHKINQIFWKYMKDKVEVTSGSLGNFANLSSYLRLKSFAWKWDYVISFFNGRWILSNFWYLDCYNFCYIFSKIAKLYFLEASHRSLKTPQKSYSEGPLLRRNDPLKIWKCCLLRCLLFQKQKMFKFWIFYLVNISTNVYHFWKFDIHGSTIVEITGRQNCYFVSLTTAYKDLITDKEKQQQTH